MPINVQCLLCKQVFVCEKDETFALVEHVKQVHPHLTYTYCKKNMDSNPDLQKSTVDEKKISTENSPETKLPIKISNKSVQVGSELNELSESTDSDVSLPSSRVNSKEEFKSTNGMSPYQSPFSLEADSNRNVKDFEKKSGSEEIRTSKFDTEKNKRETLTGPAIISQKFDPHKELVSKQPKRRTYYRTTVEHNRQGIYKVKCPNCHKRKHPVIFCHKETVTTSPFATNYLLKCWTSCFLPSIFPPPTKEYIKCSNCDYFLGIYNHQLQILDMTDKIKMAEQQKLIKK